MSLRIAEKKKKGLEQCTLFCGFYFKATPFKNQNKQTKTKPKLSMETSFNFEEVLEAPASGKGTTIVWDLRSLPPPYGEAGPYAV